MNHLLRLVNDITITKLRSKLSILSCWIIYTFSFFFFSFILDATNVQKTLDIQILDALASTISRSIHAGSTRRITRRKCSSFHASCYNIVTRARSADVYRGWGLSRESAFRENRAINHVLDRARIHLCQIGSRNSSCIAEPFVVDTVHPNFQISRVISSPITYRRSSNHRPNAQWSIHIYSVIKQDVPDSIVWGHRIYISIISCSIVKWKIIFGFMITRILSFSFLIQSSILYGKHSFVKSFHTKTLIILCEYLSDEFETIK